METQGATKTCCRCKADLPLSEFYASKEHKSGFLGRCKKCESERCRERNKLNKETRIPKAKEWQINNPEKYRQAMQASRKAAKVKNPEKVMQYFRDYREKNRAKINAKLTKREADKKQRTPDWLTAIHMAQIAEFYEVSEALSIQTGIKHHVDHIVPLMGKIVSGFHVPWNLQVLTAKENQAKGNRLID